MSTISSSSFTRPGAREHDVDLLGVLVLVPEELTLAGLEPLVADTGFRGLQVVLCESGFPDRVQPEPRG